MGRKETEARLKEEGADPCFAVRNKTVCKECARKAMWNPYERFRQLGLFVLDHVLFKLLNIRVKKGLRWYYHWYDEYVFNPMIPHDDHECAKCGQTIRGVKYARSEDEYWPNTSEICSICGKINDWQEGYFFNQPHYDTQPNAFLCKDCDDGLHMIRFAQDDFNANKPCKGCYNDYCSRNCNGKDCRNCTRDCGCECIDW